MLLHHPSFPDITEEVLDDAADTWLALGWRESPPEPGPVPDAVTQEPAADAPKAVAKADPTPDTIGGDTPDGDDQGTKK